MIFAVMQAVLGDDLMHTLGPWHVSDGEEWLAVSPPNDEDTLICEFLGWRPEDGVSRSRDECEANACLIAAAPELLQELCALIEFHGGYDHNKDCPQDDTCDCSARPLNDRLNAVINKAEGR